MEYWRSLVIRLALVFFPVSVIYFVMFYPTIYGVSLFFDSVVFGNILIVGPYVFNFIEACIAPYAYYLILLFLLFCKDVSFKLRLKLVVVGWLVILLMNVLRITV